MRNPFELKNTLDDPKMKIRGGRSMEFEESSTQEVEEPLERMAQPRIRYKIFWIAVVFLFISILSRLFFLTVIRHDHFSAIAEGNRLRIEYQPAPRGAIYDRDGLVLAGNRPSFEVVAVPLDLPATPSARLDVINRVSGILDFSPELIQASLENRSEHPFESVLIKQDISREEALIFHEQNLRLPGFRVINTPIRDYKLPEALTHVLGYVGKINPEEYGDRSGSGYLFNDVLGKTGLEQVYEEYLRGEFGQRQVEVDVYGAVEKVYGEKDPSPGDSLVLNIDAGLQEKLFESLKKRLDLLNKKRGTAIAMDPRDGRILALVSFPTYNNNLFAQGISREDYQRLVADKNLPFLNRAISGVYPPGSTVKPMVAAAALEEGVVDLETTIFDEGFIVIKNIFGGPDSFFYGFNRRALGLVDVFDAIAKSSDIFFYIVGGGYDPLSFNGLGITRLAEYYRQFRLHETLGIDLPGEKAGLVPTPEWKRERYPDDPIAATWYLGNTYHVSIGQGDLLATPLQVLSWTATIANGGKVLRPFIVDRIENNDGEVLETNLPKLVGELSISERNLEVVREGMRQTVTSGTAQSLGSLSVSVAGKTGTAQYDASDLNRVHAWFMGFAPFEEPEIAIVVLIEDGGTGAGAAVPVAREVLDWWSNERGERRLNQ